MSINTDPIRQEIGAELAFQWLKLSTQVRERAANVSNLSAGTNLESETKSLLSETTLLCDHFEKLHSNVQELMALIDRENQTVKASSTVNDDANFSQTSLKTQEKEHQEGDGLKEVIKALFMWRDDPADQKTSS